MAGSSEIAVSSSDQGTEPGWPRIFHCDLNEEAELPLLAEPRLGAGQVGGLYAGEEITAVGQQGDWLHVRLYEYEEDEEDEDKDDDHDVSPVSEIFGGVTRTLTTEVQLMLAQLAQFLTEWRRRLEPIEASRITPQRCAQQARMSFRILEHAPALHSSHTAFVTFLFVCFFPIFLTFSVLVLYVDTDVLVVHSPLASSGRRG